MRDPQDAWRRWCCRPANRVIQWGVPRPQSRSTIGTMHKLGAAERVRPCLACRSCAGIRTTWQPCGELQNSFTRWDQRSRIGILDCGVGEAGSWLVMTLHRAQHEQQAPSLNSFASEIHHGSTWGGEISRFRRGSHPGLGFVETPEQAVSIGINTSYFIQGRGGEAKRCVTASRLTPPFLTPRGAVWRWIN